MDWWSIYQDKLSHYFDVVFYDCTELAEIDVKILDEKGLHEQFINGGIEKAVQKLVDLEKQKITLLAFSVGGSIAWKYALETSNIDSIYCVSSTRLRKEIIKPSANIHLWYGANDFYKPNQKWFDKHEIVPNILDSMQHEMYKENECSKLVCNTILENNQLR